MEHHSARWLSDIQAKRAERTEAFNLNFDTGRRYRFRPVSAGSFRYSHGWQVSIVEGQHNGSDVVAEIQRPSCCASCCRKPAADVDSGDFTAVVEVQAVPTAVYEDEDGERGAPAPPVAMRMVECRCSAEGEGGGDAGRWV